MITREIGARAVKRHQSVKNGQTWSKKVIAANAGWFETKEEVAEKSRMRERRRRTEEAVNHDDQKKCSC